MGGRATSFRDPETGERVDNGQHILMGCYDETLRFLHRIGSDDRVRWQAGLAVTMIDVRGHETTLKLPPVASPLHLLGGVLAWDALSWRERASMFKIGPALRTAADDPGAPCGETVRHWLHRHGQAPRLCELFWEPLALAALNQSIDQAAAGYFVGVLQKMFGPNPLAAALVLPAVPLDELYAEPARAWLQARGSEVRTSAPARVVVEGDAVRGRPGARRASSQRPCVISTVPWHALAAAVRSSRRPRSSRRLLNAAALGSSPIVTVNLWFDRPVMSEPLIGLPGRDLPMGLRSPRHPRRRRRRTSR